MCHIFSIISAISVFIFLYISQEEWIDMFPPIFTMPFLPYTTEVPFLLVYTFWKIARDSLNLTKQILHVCYCVIYFCIGMGWGFFVPTPS